MDLGSAVVGPETLLLKSGSAAARTELGAVGSIGQVADDFGDVNRLPLEVHPDLPPSSQARDVAPPASRQVALPSPEFDVPSGYTLVTHADGTASVAGPRGENYSSTGRYTDEGKPFLRITAVVTLP